MTSAAPVAPPGGSVDRHPIADFVRQSLAIAEVELWEIVRDPTELFTRAAQPTLWLIIFGEVFSRARVIPTGSMSYLEFLAPGVLAQSVLFSGIFYGIAVIWERDLGIVHKLLVSPAARGALVFGKALSAGLRALAQAALIILLALTLGVRVSLAPANLIGVVVVVVLGGALFSSFSFVVACLVKTRERFMGIGQLLTMPLFFASTAIYPLALMPGWLRTVAAVNPLTYLVNALRELMIQGGTASTGLPADLAVLTVALVVLVIAGAWLYPTIVR